MAMGVKEFLSNMGGDEPNGFHLILDLQPDATHNFETLKIKKFSELSL